jgi:hypothetical protein
MLKPIADDLMCIDYEFWNEEASSLTTCMRRIRSTLFKARL